MRTVYRYISSDKQTDLEILVKMDQKPQIMVVLNIKKSRAFIFKIV